MLRHSHPYILNHLLLLSSLHSLIKLSRIGSRHQDNIISIEMISCKIRAMPYFCLSYFIKADMIISNLKWPKTMMKLVES